MRMTSAPVLRLSGRSSSHFTRVARMFAHELDVPIEFNVVHDLTSLDAATYGGHPALKLPTLHVGEGLLFGTDNICRKLAEVAGRADDPRVFLSHHTATDLVRNAQELVWHAMSVQVQLVVGVQIAQLPADSVFFKKARTGMLGALAWLEEHLQQVLEQLPTPRDISVFEVTLFCLVEHMVFRSTVALDPFPRLRDFATAFATRESARHTVFCFDPPPTAAPTETA
jgi:glutathione S-transferase